MTAIKPWQTREARRLRAQVLREQPLCQIGLPGCRGVADSVDHILPVSLRPELVLEPTNLQAACSYCNRKRSNAPLDALKPAPALSYFARSAAAQQHSTRQR